MKLHSLTYPFPILAGPSGSFNLKTTVLIYILLNSLLFTHSTSAQNGSPLLKKVKAATMHIGKQKYTVLKYELTVHEDPDNASSRTLTLPVQVIKALHPANSQPVFYLNGGPGASNILTTKNQQLLETHDFVCVGYRGADGNVILKSKKVNKALKGKNNQVLSNESLDYFEQTLSEYIESLHKKNINIHHYNILNVIADIETARKALGYTQIHLLSSSYGTRVALLYSYKYPQIIKNAVLVGPNPPGYFIWWPWKTDEIVSIYDRTYTLQHPSDSLSIRSAMQLAFKNMPKKWRGFTLDADKIKMATFSLLYQKELAFSAFDAYFRAARKNDYSGLYLMQLASDVFSGKIIIGDMCAKGLSADFNPAINYRDTLRAFPSAILGPNNALLLWGGAKAIPVQLIPEEYRKIRRCETPMLIISGDLDVSTPADFTRDELMPYLPNGRQLILKNMSHSDLNNEQVEAYRLCINQFFDSGTVNETAFKDKGMSFKPKYKLSKLAKRFYPLILIYKLFH